MAAALLLVLCVSAFFFGIFIHFPFFVYDPIERRTESTRINTYFIHPLPNITTNPDDFYCNALNGFLSIWVCSAQEAFSLLFSKFSVLSFLLMNVTNVIWFFLSFLFSSCLFIFWVVFFYYREKTDGKDGQVINGCHRRAPIDISLYLFCLFRLVVWLVVRWPITQDNTKSGNIKMYTMCIFI